MSFNAKCRALWIGFCLLLLAGVFVDEVWK